MSLQLDNSKRTGVLGTTMNRISQHFSSQSMLLPAGFLPHLVSLQRWLHRGSAFTLTLDQVKGLFLSFHRTILLAVYSGRSLVQRMALTFILHGMVVMVNYIHVLKFLRVAVGTCSMLSNRCVL